MPPNPHTLARGHQPIRSSRPGRRFVRGVVLGVALLATAELHRPLAAQMTPTDSAAVLLQTARDFEREGDRETAQAILIYITQRFGSTPAADDARARLTGPAGDRLDPVSRIELPVFGTLYGLWLGVAVPAMFGSESAGAYGAGLLIGGPLGLFSSIAVTRSRHLTEGQARAISWGGVWGTWQGFGWGRVLDIGRSEACTQGTCYSEDQSPEAVLASMVIGGLTGIATGAVIARNPVRSGVSSGAQGGSIWGTVYGGMVVGMFDPNGEDVGLAATLIAGDLGLIAGATLAGKYQISRPRVRMINLGALVGLVGGFGIDLLIDPDGEKVALGIPLVTSLAGLGIAAHATRDSDRRFEPGDDTGGALFGWTDEGLQLGAPMPMPAMLPTEDVNGRRAWRPGISVELFRARFGG
jgi:hypothetical protein